MGHTRNSSTRPANAGRGGMFLIVKLARLHRGLTVLCLSVLVAAVRLAVFMPAIDVVGKRHVNAGKAE